MESRFFSTELHLVYCNWVSQLTAFHRSDQTSKNQTINGINHTRKGLRRPVQITLKMKCTNTETHACAKAQMRVCTRCHKEMHACAHTHTHTHTQTLSSYESRQWSRSILAWWFIYLLLAITEDIVSAPPINLCYFPQHRDLESSRRQGKLRWWNTSLTFLWGTCTAVSRREC